MIQHLINNPIEANELSDKRHHLNGDEAKLCFYYHKGLAVGYEVELTIHYHSVIGMVVMCEMINEELFKGEVVFVDEKEAFKVRMLEQAARIELYQTEHPELTLEDAANKWVEENGALFPQR